MKRSNRSGFTLLELIFAIGIILLASVALLPAVTGCKAPATRIKCVNNLKNIGLAFRIYATDNHELFPWESRDTTLTNRHYFPNPASYFRPLSNEISTPKILICPTDKFPEPTSWTSFTRQNLSYFVSPSASQSFPQAFLAGDRNITTNGACLPRGLVRLAKHAPLKWGTGGHTNQGNICMSDGSVQQLSSSRLVEQLRNSDLPGDTLLPVP